MHASIFLLVQQVLQLRLPPMRPRKKTISFLSEALDLLLILGGDLCASCSKRHLNSAFHLLLYINLGSLATL